MTEILGTCKVVILLCLTALAVMAQEKPSNQAPAAGGPGDDHTNRGPGRIQFPKPVPAPQPIESSIASLTNNTLRLVGPGVFELGGVLLDRKARTVSFPAVLNRVEGPMEYFLVTKYGKTHESILRTEASPYNIHIAMLLLGAVGTETNIPPGIGPNFSPGPIKNPSETVLPGDKISIEVSWGMLGKERHRAEELVYNGETHSVPEAGHWVYNGSFVLDGRFFAQMDGSIISLITDPVALINNTAAGHANDRIWSANTNNLPPMDVPLQVILKLQDKPTP